MRNSGATNSLEKKWEKNEGKFDKRKVKWIKGPFFSVSVSTFEVHQVELIQKIWLKGLG